MKTRSQNLADLKWYSQMFGLSTESITKGKLANVTEEIRVLTFRALDLRQSESLEASGLESLYGGQFIFSSKLC